MEQLLALADCNNFFVSCERVFNPGLRNVPVIVLSSNDGCVVARSEEAKALGIPMGAPVFRYRDLIRRHRVFELSSNFALYADMSGRVMKTLARFTPRMEQYSIDEAFLSLEGVTNPLARGREIKAAVEQWTGIPISIGIGPTKTLAKIAGRLAKREQRNAGVFNLAGHPDAEDLLAGIKVEDVWGIGPKSAGRLNQAGVFTARHLKNADDALLRRAVSVAGLKTAWELRSIPCLQLEDIATPKKQVIRSRQFGRPVTSRRELQEAVADHVTLAAKTLRTQNSVAAGITVFIETSRFRTPQAWYANTACLTFPEPTAHTPRLIRYGHQCLDKIYRPGRRFVRAGVILLDITSAENSQLSLLPPERSARKEKTLMQAVDRINEALGADTLRYASAGITRPWGPKQARRSPCYTTRWDDLPVVKC